MSLLPPAMRDQDQAPMALGPAIRKPKEPSAEEQRRAQVRAFERGDHQPDGKVAFVAINGALLAGSALNGWKLHPNGNFEGRFEQQQTAQQDQPKREQLAAAQINDALMAELNKACVLRPGPTDEELAEMTRLMVANPPVVFIDTIRQLSADWPQPCEYILQSGGSE